MTAPASDGTDSTSGRFRLTIPQMLWLVALCGLASGFVTRAMQSTGTYEPRDLAFSPDGRLIAATSERDGVLVWDISGPRPRRIGDPIASRDDVYPLNMRRYGNFQFSGPDTVTLSVYDYGIGRLEFVHWDVRKNEPTGAVQLRTPIDIASHCPDSGITAVSDFQRSTINFVGPSDVGFAHRVEPAEVPVSIGFVNDGGQLVVVESSYIESFRVEDGERMSAARLRSAISLGEVAVEISRDGRYVAFPIYAAEPQESKLQIVSGDGKEVLTINAPSITSACFLHGSDQIAVGSDLGVEIWDIATRKPVRTIELRNPRITDLAVSPDERTLAIAEEDRISLWDLQTGQHTSDVWSRNAFFEALLFSAGFFGWAVVWGLMRRRRPKADAMPEAEQAEFASGRSRPKQFVFQITVARLVVMLVVAGILMAIPVTLLASVSLEGDVTALLMALGKALLLGPIILFALVLLLLLVKKKILHTHGAELRRAQGIARAAGRTAQFGNITAYFFGAPTLEANFGRDLAIVRRRLETLLGDLAEAPDVPAFCFASQDEFNVYLARNAPLSAVYSPPWWCRQLILCQRPGHSIADPRELLRTLLGYLLLWNHKGFRTPYWITSVVNAYAVYGDDAAHLAAVHRRLAVELAREETTLTPLPLELDDKQYVKLVMKRDQREPLRKTLLYSDICASLSGYLLGDGQRRRRFGDFLQGLTRRDGVEEALRREYGCGVERLFEDWLTWFRQGIAEGSLDTSTYETPTECERQQIAEDVVPLVLNPDADLDLRCRAARNLAGGSLLGAEALIGLLADAPDELRQDVLWSLEAIAGRRFGEDPAAWRLWLEQVKTTASPATDEADSPVNAELLNDSADDGASPQDQTSPSATTAAASEALPTAKSRPISTPPKTLTICWNLMILGGAVAILWPSLMLFTAGLTRWPLFYYGLAMGVFAVSRGVGRHLRWLRLVGFLQVLAAVSCDPVNPVLGVAVLVLSRTKRAREYLAAQK